MEWSKTSLPFRDTGYFSRLILDYLDQSAPLRPFFTHTPDLAGIQNAIVARQQIHTDRALLVQQLRLQYKEVSLTSQEEKSLELLANENTFTITTAHQPNLFTGPLYFIYKLLHAIRIAEQLNHDLPEYKFVPLYWMGTEDADVDELDHCIIQGKTYQWKTKPHEAFGRKLIDQSLTKLITEVEHQLASLPHTTNMIMALRSCYAEGKTIAQATFEWVHHLMGYYGLLVLMPDAPALKAVCREEMKADLWQHAAYEVLENTKKHFPYPQDWQANARPINLFYLKDDLRERIEREGDHFKVVNTTIVFSQDELLNLLHSQPECFSPNVILRPVFQEKILPNVAYVGGPGELSYWLQFRSLFEYYRVPFPVLFLRNSVLLVTSHQNRQLLNMGFELSDVFLSTEALMKLFTHRHSAHSLELADEKEQVIRIFKLMGEKAGRIDVTLSAHVEALLKGVMNKTTALEGKMLRAEKRRFQDALHQLQKMKASLFPGDTLHERKENMLSYYAANGEKWVQELYQQFPSIHSAMLILTHA